MTNQENFPMRSTIRVLMITSEWPAPGQPRTTHFIKRQADFLRAAGVDVEVFPFKGRKNPINYLRAWIKTQKRLREKPFDLVHAQFGQSGLLALPKNTPLVVTFRGSDLLGIVNDKNGQYTRQGKIGQRVSRTVASCADAVIVVSEHMKRFLSPNIQAHVIPSGIDLNLFRCMPQGEARSQLGLPSDERLILFVGRPSQARKRFEISSRAVEILNQTLSARLIVAWGVDHSDIPLYMNACDALVFTSMQEGSPNVVKEALACNLPVVSVPIGDVASRIGNIEGCELCADDRPETVASSLERVLRRGQRIDGRETVKSLDEGILTRQVIEIYKSILINKKQFQLAELSLRVSS
jgi:glycosyltransferase involved in cell wall biosynthesis